MNADMNAAKTAEAIKHYHALLHTARAQDAIQKLQAAITRYNLRFGTRAICSALRPFLLPAAQYEYFRDESLLVLTAIQKLYRALVADARLRAELDLTRDEELLCKIEPGFAAPDVSGRLDAFLDSRGDFSFVEYNADSPGGLLYGDVLAETFLDMDILREFGRKYPVRRVRIRPRLLQTLLETYREWGWQERPRIAIVDWKEVQTRAEFDICRAYFEAQGYPTVIVDPGELEYRGGWLRAGDFQVNLVYKRVVIGELLARGGLQHPLVRAVKERAVCCVNSFRAQMLFKKSLFALLDDPAQERLFSAQELAALRKHIPWTRKLREGHTTYRGRRIDLLEFVAANRDRLVIKPNGDYGGRGVCLGWESDYADWVQEIQDALGGSFVVQERVEVLPQTFPLLVGDEIKLEERFVDFDPYTWGGEDIDGAGIRLSSSALLNVSAGGGSATPLLLLEN